MVLKGVGIETTNRILDITRLGTVFYIKTEWKIRYLVGECKQTNSCPTSMFYDARTTYACYFHTKVYTKYTQKDISIYR